MCCSPLIQDGLHGSEPIKSESCRMHKDVSSTDEKSADRKRRGSAGAVGSMKLLKSYQSMHAPFTLVSISRHLTTFGFLITISLSQGSIDNITHIYLEIVIGSTTDDRRHA